MQTLCTAACQGSLCITTHQIAFFGKVERAHLTCFVPTSAKFTPSRVNQRAPSPINLPGPPPTLLPVGPRLPPGMARPRILALESVE